MNIIHNVFIQVSRNKITDKCKIYIPFLHRNANEASWWMQSCTPVASMLTLTVNLLNFLSSDMHSIIASFFFFGTAWAGSLNSTCNPNEGIAEHTLSCHRLYEVDRNSPQRHKNAHPHAYQTEIKGTFVPLVFHRKREDCINAFPHYSEIYISSRCFFSFFFTKMS